MLLDEAAQKLREFYKQNKRLPSYQELCDLFGFASKKTAFALAKKLIDAGIIEKDSSGKLLPKRLFAVLPFYGAVKAGYPSAAEEHLFETMSFDTYLVNKPEHSFVLRVSGDSMIDAGINEGDLVIIEKDKQAKDGDVVVALVDGEYTLKYYYKRNSIISLVPANKRYPVIYPKESLSIWGIVVSVMRKYH
jgi:SOS regulatory protein LexA